MPASPLTFTDQSPSALAELLRNTRTERKLTQQQLAESAGCSIAYVQVLERGLTPRRRSDVLPRIFAVLFDDDEAELSA